MEIEYAETTFICRPLGFLTFCLSLAPVNSVVEGGTQGLEDIIKKKEKKKVKKWHSIFCMFRESDVTFLGR